MSSKLPAPAVAALLALAAIAPESALAKRPAAPHHAYRHGSSYGQGTLRQPQVDDLNRGRPLRAGRPFETDPDAHIRFEMNRDDRDRRLGGS